MGSIGRQVIETIGTSIRVSADGRPEAKPAGVTVDWTTVADVSGAAVNLEDGIVVDIGDSYLRHGQILCKISASGKYGPYDPAASDGRQTLAKGDCFIVDRTIRETDQRSDHPPVIDGGRCWKARILMTTGTHSLAAGPTVTEFQAVFPRVTYAE